MAGTDSGNAGGRGLDGVERHRFGPGAFVGAAAGREVAVLDPEGDGRADRASLAHAAADLGVVGFDLHPPAAPVAFLAARQLPANLLFREGQPGGQAVNDDGQARSVGFACCEPPKVRHRSLRAVGSVLERLGGLRSPNFRPMVYSEAGGMSPGAPILGLLPGRPRPARVAGRASPRLDSSAKGAWAVLGSPPSRTPYRSNRTSSLRIRRRIAPCALRSPRSHFRWIAQPQ